MPLSVNNKSIESSGLTKDYREAICEYIWNGLEANATEICISYTLNALGGVDSVKITDNGNGIDYNDLSETFGAFLFSKKNNLSLKVKAKANKGKGRFSFSLFATTAVWDTNFCEGEQIKNFTITLSDSNKQEINYTKPLIKNNATGTTVTFYNINSLTEENLTSADFKDYILLEFAWYLYLHKHSGIKIVLNGTSLDYNEVINDAFSVSESIMVENKNFLINLIVWKRKIKEKFCCYYLNEENILKGSETTTFNRNTVDFNHSVFVLSSYFDNCVDINLSDDSTQLMIGQPEDYKVVLNTLKKSIQDLINSVLSSYMASKADEEIDRMINVRKTFPNFSNDIYGQLKRKDLMRVTKELYCLEPKLFYKLKEVQEKSLLAFLNLLLNSEERENVLSIIEQIVELSSEQRVKFTELLQKTKLENIINTIRFVEGRYEVIEVLKHLVYDLSKFTNEREHIQSIVEQHYWLFGEQYSLASADVTMKKALEKYLSILYGASKPDGTLVPDEEENRRMDIFLCGARKTENSFETMLEENIVIELKAPKVTLSKKVLRQVEDYMDYVRRQPQFSSIQRRWKFIAVCCQVDDDVKALYKTFENFGKPCLVNKIDDFEIYALCWDDIFTNFNLKHGFMLDRLKFNRDMLSNELSEMDASRTVANKLTQRIIK